MESKRHSRDLEKDLSRDLHKAEWKLKEEKLQDDIKTLRQQLLLLVSLLAVCSPFSSCTTASLLPPPPRVSSSRIERGLLPTTGATPCWSRRRWIRR